MNTENNFFNDYEAMPPKSINEPHQPVLLLCDTSDSMTGVPIRNLVASVNRFAADITRTQDVGELVDVSVVGFNDKPYLVQDWRPANEMQPLELQAGGMTNLSAALEFSIAKLKERGHLYHKTGIDVKMPYLILITDGYGGDVTEVAKIIKQRTEERKMQLWILAVKGYDEKTVAVLSEGKRVFELVYEDGYDFSEFFNFMTVSIKAVSQSAPGERIKVSDEDNPLKKEDSNLKVPDLNSWLND